MRGRAQPLSLGEAGIDFANETATTEPGLATQPVTIEKAACNIAEFPPNWSWPADGTVQTGDFCGTSSHHCFARAIFNGLVDLQLQPRAAWS